MQKVFNNEYYEDPANGEDEEKPVFSDSEAGRKGIPTCTRACTYILIQFH